MRVVILASGSPRRRDLLGRICADFRVVPSGIEERLAGPPTPAAVAALALEKARVVAGLVSEGIVVGADTVVVVDGEALGKPVGADDARVMLRRLRGRTHEVITGVAVVDAATGRAASTAVVTGVTMRDVADDVIDAYVAGGEPLDKAGAYAIQEGGAALIAGFVGSYSSVVGLPLAETARLLKEFGVPVTSSHAGPDASPAA